MIRYLSFAFLALALPACDAMTSHTDVVARVGAHELTVDETVELLATNPQIPAQAEVVGSVAELWVDYTMLAELAAEDSALAGIDLTAMLDPYVEQRTFIQLRQQVMTTDTVLDEAQLRELFSERAPGLRVRARHILLTYPDDADEGARDSVRALAEELRQRAESGADFDALAREYSQDPGTAQSGGDLGWFGRGRMVQPFEEAAFALEPGQVSQVVETPFGLHIIRVEEREAPTWDEEQGEEFRRRMVAERRQASLDEYVESLREPASFEVQQGAPDVARDLAEDPSKRLSDRAADRRLVTWDGGSLTAGEFVNMLRRLPPQQQSQYATAPEEQLESVLRDLATNQLVMQDARERGISVPQEEQDSIRDLLEGELKRVIEMYNLGGEPQEGETEAEAVERRVRSLLEGILTGQRNMIPLGPLAYTMRDQVEWRIHESAFPEVVEGLQERRQSQQNARPMPPTGQPQGGQTPAPQSGSPPRPAPDTAG